MTKIRLGDALEQLEDQNDQLSTQVKTLTQDLASAQMMAADDNARLTGTITELECTLSRRESELEKLQAERDAAVQRLGGLLHGLSYPIKALLDIYDGTKPERIPGIEEAIVAAMQAAEEMTRVTREQETKLKGLTEGIRGKEFIGEPLGMAISKLHAAAEVRSGPENWADQVLAIPVADTPENRTHEAPATLHGPTEDDKVVSLGVARSA